MVEQNIIETSDNTDQYIDLLDRKKLAKNLIDVISLQNANVYSINAPWGSGKTWFLKFIEDECKEQNIPFAQFNVWETDYAKDPFQAILCELLELLQQQIQHIKNEDVITQINKDIFLIKKKAQEFLTIINRMSFNLGVGIPNTLISAEINVNPDESSLAEYIRMKSIKQSFIEDLKAFIDEFNTKFIIAIDELDRCRPDYAITTLEIIKHFFNINNVVFILAVDKEQLQTTVKTMFGLDTDTDAYLRKFVDIQYHLPKASIESFIKYIVENKYPIINLVLKKLIGNRYIDVRNGEFTDYGGNYNKSLSIYIDYFKKSELSLRDIEKLSLKISIALLSIAKQGLLLSLDFLIPLVVLNVKYNKIYEKIKNWESIRSFSEIEGKYWHSAINFTTIYAKMIEIRNDKSVRYRPNIWDSYLESLSKYFSIIDFAEDFS